MTDPLDTIDQQEGTIKMLNRDKGFGFIRRAGSTDLFFHVTECGDGQTNYKDIFDNLEEGERVTFTIADGKKGPEGRNITTVN